MFNIIDIIVILIILLSVFLGYKKGFVRTTISLLSFFIAIGLALLFYKPVAVILTENTTIDEWIIENIASDKKDEELDETTNNDGDTLQGTDAFLDMIGNLPSTFIAGFDLEEIKTDTKQEIAYKISELIMNLLSLIIIYVVVKLTLVIAAFILDGIMKFPVLKQLNEILGMVIGAVIGFLEVYVAFAIITFISSICDISVVINTIKISAFARILFENNLIINLLF